MNNRHEMLVDGRLMRKMIKCDLPYYLQMQVIHMDDVDPKFISNMCDELQKVDKAHKALTKDREFLAFFNVRHKQPLVKSV